MQQTISPVGDAAIGTIGPEPRIKSGAITSADVSVFVERFAGDEFYEEVGYFGPNAAGGTFTLVMADALSARRFYEPGMKSDAHARVMYEWLVQHADTEGNRMIIPRQCMDERPIADGSQPSQGLIGGHDSTHGEDDCGAIKKMEAILQYITDHADVLQTICITEGCEVSDSLHKALVQNARELLDSGYVADAFTMRKVLVSVADESAVARLNGDHNGVALRKNRNANLTLHRNKAEKDFGTNIQGFNIDVGVFEPCAKLLAGTDDESIINALTIAMEYYNTAAALVLGHSSIVYVRDTITA